MKVWFCRHYSGVIEEQEENIPEWVPLERVGSLELLPNMERVVTEGLQFLKDNQYLSSENIGPS